MSVLADLIGRETQLVQMFLASLNAEQAALTRGEVDALAGINQKKTELVEQLNVLEGQRNAGLQRAGYTGDRKGMQAWLERNPSQQAIAKAWVKLMDLAAEAKELHNLNGQLISMRLQATNQALAALTRQPQKPSLYGPDGHAAQRTGSRIIDAA